MHDAAEEPVPAEVAYAGTWRLEHTEASDSATLSLRYPPSASNSSGPIALAKLGLTAGVFANNRHPFRFELRREAGTFACEGRADDARGNGAFRFTPDAAYANALAETGLRPLTLHEHIKAGLFDVSSSFVKTIVATGIAHVTFSQLLSLKLFQITHEQVSALHAEFPSAGLDDIRALAMTGVTSGYVDALRRANVGDLSADNVSALRAAGIDQAFIEGLAANGHRDLSIDDIVYLHGNGS